MDKRQFLRKVYESLDDGDNVAGVFVTPQQIQDEAQYFGMVLDDDSVNAILENIADELTREAQAIVESTVYDSYLVLSGE